MNTDPFVYLFQNGFRFDPILYTKKGIEIFRTNVGYFITFTLLLMVALFIIRRILPDYINWLPQTLLPIFSVGYYWVCNQTYNKEKIEMRDFLIGFSNFGPCYVAGLVTVLPLLISGIVGRWLGWPLSLLPFCVSLGIFLCYIFVVPLVFFHNASLWSAMETSRKIAFSRPKEILLLYAIIAAANIAGMLALLVGLLASIPLSHAIIYSAYEDIVSQNHDKV